AEDGRVLYVNTFSKVLFPGLRTGYVVVPDVHRGPLLAAIEAGARPPSALEQRALGRFVESGAYLRHLRRVRGRYATLRSASDRARQAATCSSRCPPACPPRGSRRRRARRASVSSHWLRTGCTERGPPT